MDNAHLILNDLAYSTNSEVSSAVSRCESIDEVEEKVLEDNRARCDFFKDFEFDVEGIIGSVSS